MAAIDESAIVTYYEYKNKTWMEKELSFPASMDSTDLRKYLGFINDVNHCYPCDEHPLIKIFIKYDKKTNLKTYLLNVEVFMNFQYIIICEGFPNLCHLLKELKPFIEISMNDDYMNDDEDMDVWGV